jgi:hypothetical protein
MAIDIFIPIIAGNMVKLPGALYSALTQTYQDNNRVIMFFDHNDVLLEKFAEKWWYTPQDSPRSNLIECPHHAVPLPLTLEYCTRGVIVRNPNGPMGSAGFARQWIFEWSGKSSYVKFLDSDDILAPECLHYMMKVMTPECAGVICPMFFVSACRMGRPLGHGSGSGSFLFKKETMEAIVKDGFVWNRNPGHDRPFTEYLKEKRYKFNKTEEDLIYIYLKS